MHIIYNIFYNMFKGLVYTAISFENFKTIFSTENADPFY